LVFSKINKNNEFILSNLSLLCDSLDIFLIHSNVVNEILRLFSKSFNIFYEVNYLKADILKTNSSNLYKPWNRNNKKDMNKKHLSYAEEPTENDDESKKILNKLLQILKVNKF